MDALVGWSMRCNTQYQLLRKQLRRTSLRYQLREFPSTQTELSDHFPQRPSTMISRILPHVGLSKISRLRSMMKEFHSRGYSTTLIHSNFPATLMRLNAGPTYKPFHCERPVQSKEQITNVASVQSQANHQNAKSWTHCLGMSSS
jgi:hypothetical protein